MPSRPAEPGPALRRRPWRRLSALALLALAPKCALCLAGWLGLGAALGLGGPEMCGAPPSAIGAETAALVAGGALALLAGAGLPRRARRRA